jgi:hypothetical protein
VGSCAIYKIACDEMLAFSFAEKREKKVSYGKTEKREGKRIGKGKKRCWGPWTNPDSAWGRRIS